MEAWLRTHEVEETTRTSYEMYARVHVYPVFGDEPIGKVDPRLLEEFYAELRRCSARCDGRSFVEHRVDDSHECRMVKHRRRPGCPPAAGPDGVVSGLRCSNAAPQRRRSPGRAGPRYGELGCLSSCLAARSGSLVR